MCFIFSAVVVLMNIVDGSDIIWMKSVVFSPNYTLPPARSNPDVLAIDISQAWGPAIDLRDPRFLAFATAEHQLLQSEYDDYAIASSSSLACFRYVAIIMMLLLSVRQMLMVARDFQMLRESSSFFNFQISLLQLAGFLLPCYVMARSWYVVQCRRRRQVSYLSETACLTALFQLEFCSTHDQIISSYSGLLKLASSGKEYASGMNFDFIFACCCYVYEDYGLWTMDYGCVFIIFVCEIAL
nr:Protein involved in mRNA turnover and stability [Ipomoea batatas]